MAGAEASGMTGKLVGPEMAECWGQHQKGVRRSSRELQQPYLLEISVGDP